MHQYGVFAMLAITGTGQCLIYVFCHYYCVRERFSCGFFVLLSVSCLTESRVVYACVWDCARLHSRVYFVRVWFCAHVIESAERVMPHILQDRIPLLGAFTGTRHLRFPAQVPSCPSSSLPLPTPTHTYPHLPTPTSLLPPFPYLPTSLPTYTYLTL